MEYGRCREYTGLGGTAEHAGEYDGLIQGLLATLGHQGWDCRGHGDSEGLQGIMVAYRRDSRLRVVRSMDYIIISAAGRLGKQYFGELLSPNTTL